MFTRGVFADAEAEAEQADFLILGMPYDATGSFRTGCREGPSALRKASYNFEPYDCRHRVDLSTLRVADAGDLELGSDPSAAWQSIEDAFGFLPSSPLPVVMGGEHSITPPIVGSLAGIGEIGVLVLDAHLDLRDEYGGSSLSHACASRRMLEQPIRGYSTIGIRSGSEEEFEWAMENGIDYHTAEEVEERGIASVLEDALSCIAADRIYLSIDMDVLDPAYAPAVGNPEPFGLDPRQVRHVVEQVAGRAAGLDVVEIAPAYDGGQTAALGARLIRDFLARASLG
ncbi:MAG: agmatinase [Methanosaeta sp. PtaB.Bin039]|nr:MAG: agmatinase [Methanosaeta sp. PtaB.Bin039]HOT07672.1 agmatinase [Methanotrichaceae archaeon]HQF17527.1 agmatinase [Methanotrichaceae archaeon]HQI92068.1 agmatinase [Methanotrichaceae archaeon]HQJ29307.1 agmatinase [Methanotrichaceae archaeon]